MRDRPGGVRPLQAISKSRVGVSAWYDLFEVAPEDASKALATSFTLRKNRPQLFLTPRVKRYCAKDVLLFASSELTEGLYIRAVVGAGRRYSVGAPRTRASYQTSLSPVWPTDPEGGRLRWRLSRSRVMRATGLSRAPASGSPGPVARYYHLATPIRHTNRAS